MNKRILTNEQVRKAIYQDYDFDAQELERLSEVASSFLLEKTSHNFAEDKIIHPLAIQCATVYVKQLYFNGEKYNKDFDYSFGLTGMLVDLQNIAKTIEEEKTEEEENGED